MYLTFEEYQNMGGTIKDAATFLNFEFSAETKIDYYTFNRLAKETEIPRAVKMCMLQLIQLGYEQAQSMQLGMSQAQTNSNVELAVTSQSNDGVSVSYNVMNAQTAYQTIQSEVDRCINMYLGDIRNSLGHRLLYRGVYPDE